jgi:hypothetical protein
MRGLLYPSIYPSFVPYLSHMYLNEFIHRKEEKRRDFPAWLAMV